MQDRNGAKLSHTDAQKSSFIQDRPGHLVATPQMIDRLPPFLERQLGRPVVDRTGLKGLFSFTLEWDPKLESAAANPLESAGVSPPDNSSGITGLSLATALREQLGLRLESKKGPVQVYVVEKIERPGDN